LYKTKNTPRSELQSKNPHGFESLKKKFQLKGTKTQLDNNTAKNQKNVELVKKYKINLNSTRYKAGRKKQII